MLIVFASCKGASTYWIVRQETSFGGYEDLSRILGQCLGSLKPPYEQHILPLTTVGMNDINLMSTRRFLKT